MIGHQNAKVTDNFTLIVAACCRTFSRSHGALSMGKHHHNLGLRLLDLKLCKQKQVCVDQIHIIGALFMKSMNLGLSQASFISLACKGGVEYLLISIVNYKDGFHALEGSHTTRRIQTSATFIIPTLARLALSRLEGSLDVYSRCLFENRETCKTIFKKNMLIQDTSSDFSTIVFFNSFPIVVRATFNMFEHRFWSHFLRL